MKLLKFLIPAAILFVAGVIITSPISSCNKKTLIHDTTTVHDTTIVKDTVTIIDTVGCCNINSDMVAYYTFTGGSLKDSSGNHNDIVFNNATKTTDRFGNANGAYLFDGSSSYMRVTNSATLNPANITLMAIVKFNDFYRGSCHGNQILMKGYQDQSQGVYSLRVANISANCSDPVDTSKEEAIGFYGDYPQVSGTMDTTDYIKTNKWVTLIYTYDGYEAKLYVNGQLKSVVAGTSPFTANANDLFIGRAENVSIPYWFNGVIDEVRIYNKALCGSAVTRLSN